VTRAPDAVRDAIEAARSDGYTADDGLRVLVSSRFEGDWSLAGELEDDFDAMDRSGDGGGEAIDAGVRDWTAVADAELTYAENVGLMRERSTARGGGPTVRDMPASVRAARPR